jgi:tetratricopeptide (TPR) repeat protein
MRIFFSLYFLFFATCFAEDCFELAFKAEELGEYDEAIRLYKKSFEQIESSSDLWKIKLQLGKCYQAKGEWSEALYWYLESYKMDSNRIDPLLALSTYYRSVGDNELAYIFAKHGSRFAPLRDYQIDHELSIVSFYTRFKEDGYKAASDLMISRDAPWHIKSQAFLNVLYYVEHLKNAHFRPILIDLPFICDESVERYHPTNPSILCTESGYKVICRAVNYTQKGAKEFDTVDPLGYFQTRNFLIDYSKDFKILSSQEIIEDLPRYRHPTCNVLGLEDARLFSFQNSLWFTCTNRDNTLDGVPQISLCKLGEDAQVESMIPLQGPDPYRCEKNWLPFIENGTFYTIYSYDPFIVYKPDIYTGECALEINYKPNHDFSQFRGSAGPVKFGDGYLILVHEVVFLPDFSRCYLHRFVELDRRFFVKGLSKPFVFLHQGVEFCPSMTLNHEGTHLVLAVGIEDNKAFLCTVDLKTVKSLLTPLPL